VHEEAERQLPGVLGLCVVPGLPGAGCTGAWVDGWRVLCLPFFCFPALRTQRLHGLQLVRVRGASADVHVEGQTAE
jgi:hypothetical protein